MEGVFSSITLHRQGSVTAKCGVRAGNGVASAGAIVAEMRFILIAVGREVNGR